MGNVSQTFAKMGVKENEHKFIVYFLYDDEDQNVHVEEVEEVDFSKVVQHLNLGGSVFISNIRRPELNETSYARRANELMTDVEVVPVSSHEIVRVLGSMNIEQVEEILDKY